jgi:hypothetical protein
MHKLKGLSHKGFSTSKKQKDPESFNENQFPFSENDSAPQNKALIPTSVNPLVKLNGDNHHYQMSKKYQYFVKPESQFFNWPNNSVKLIFKEKEILFKPNLTSSVSSNQYTRSLINNYTIKQQENPQAMLAISMANHAGGYRRSSPKSRPLSKAISLQSRQGGKIILLHK